MGKLQLSDIKAGADIYETRIWRYWASHCDVIHYWSTEKEAMDDIEDIRLLANPRDRITVKYNREWDVKRLYSEVIS